MSAVVMVSWNGKSFLACKTFPRVGIRNVNVEKLYREYSSKDDRHGGPLLGMSGRAALARPWGRQIIRLWTDSGYISRLPTP